MVNTMEYVEAVMSGKPTQTCSSLKVLDIGCGDGSRGKKQFGDCQLTQIDRQTGWDITKHGLPKGPWDILFAWHIIEHLEDPDMLLDMCKKEMTADSLLILGTPNLTAWFNRILFLFGYLPHSYEVSYRHNLGKPFGWNKEEVGGHLRVMTIPVLIDLLLLHGFKDIKVKAETSNYPTNWIIKSIDWILTHINRNLCSSFVVTCRYY